MGAIRILPSGLVDQIAAGEVVERPASVVKELVENALDARARSIAVEIEDGGVGAIRVVDDGAGMVPDDARLAVERHATSKIQAFEDLVALVTLGFRGEALPSIASVSRFTLTTRAADALEATRVYVEGTAPPVVRATGGPPGTTVEVRDLFFNVPARRKFLRSTSTEVAHVVDTVERVALAVPDVRVTLRRDGKLALELLPERSAVDRVSRVLRGEKLAEIGAGRDGVVVRAYLAPPERARAGTSDLHTFVNGRPVRDRQLARAIAFAYGSVLPPGRFPIGAVFLELPPGDVDVNVHPQKTEVRFARGRVVLDAVTRALAAELGTRAWSRPGSAARSAPVPLEFAPASPEPDGTAAAPGEPPVEAAAPARRAHAFWEERLPVGPTSAPPGRVRDAELSFFATLRPLAQVQRLFVLAEGPDGIYFLDQHAADERVRYERLRASHAARAVATQQLLFPERVELSRAEIDALEAHADAVLAVGLDVSRVGPTTAAVRAIPRLLARTSAERLLRDLLGELEKTGERGFGDAIDTALATMACHAAIRAGDALSPQECAALLRDLAEVPSFGGHCPHGRPVAHVVTFGELERRLGR